jgi:spore maturation protein CgeB
VTVFDPERRLSWLRRSRVLNRATWSLQHHAVSAALSRYLERAERWDAVLVFKGYFLTRARLVRGRARTGVPWLNYNPDDPFDPGRATSSRHIRESLGAYDVYLIWSRELAGELERRGARRAVYLPFAYDRSRHFPAPERDPALAGTLTFVGSYDERRAQLLSALAGLPLAIYGNAWEHLPRSSPLRACVRSQAIFGSELRRVVSSSLASVNILRPQNEGAHNMRTFEVPAMGGVMLTTRSPEQQTFFPEGEASLMYGDARELREVSERLVRGAYDTAAIRRAALERSHGKDYEARARAILDLLHWT